MDFGFHGSHRFAFDEAGNASHPYKSKRWLLLKWKVASSMDLFLHFGSRASTKLWIKVRHTVREIQLKLTRTSHFSCLFQIHQMYDENSLVKQMLVG